MRGRPLPSSEVFTVEDAVAAGWTHSALKNAVRRGRVVRLRRGVYARAGADASRPVVLGAVAAALRLRRVVVSHRSAAFLHDLPVLGPPPPLPEVTVAPRAGANLAGVHPYRATLRPQDVTVRCGVPTTAVARTVIDLARHRPVGVAVAAIDAALHRDLVTAEELHGVLEFCQGWPLERRAVRAVRLADGRAKSPLESLSRLALPSLGIPAPRLQVPVHDQVGRFVARTDFYWDEFGVVGEADGRGKYDARAVLTAEKRRQEALEELGLVVVRWGWAEATSGRHELRVRLQRAFERGRRRDLAGFPRLWTL